jgi:hypothetical protein
MMLWRMERVKIQCNFSEHARVTMKRGKVTVVTEPSREGSSLRALHL